MQTYELTDPDRLVGVKIVRAGDMEAFAKGHDLLAEVTAEAEARRGQHMKDLEDERVAGFSEAYGEGAIEFLQAVDDLQAALDTLEADLQSRFEAALRSVFDERTAEEIMAASIRRVIQDCLGERALTVSVHPSHVARLEVVLGTQALQLSDTPLRFEADPTLEPGQGFVFSQKNVFEISVDVALDMLVDAFSPAATRIMANEPHEEAIS